VTGFVAGLASRTLLPIFSRLEPGDPQLHRYRRFLMGAALLPLGGFLIGGSLLIQCLYDPRYAPAGAMLQVLALGASAAVLRVMAEPVLLARGDTFSRMILGICEAVLVMTCVTIGGVVGGLSGLIMGFVIGQFLTLIPTFWLLSRHNAWAMRDDFLFLATALLLALVGWTLHPPSLALL
jgi:O-antigen/teichoic acid export membrane protein